MRILVQDAGSGTYFDGAAWKADAEAALSFDSVAHAETFCQNQNLQDAVIIVRFNSPDQEDVTYSVGSRSAVLVSKSKTTRIKSVL